MKNISGQVILSIALNLVITFFAMVTTVVLIVLMAMHVSAIFAIIMGMITLFFWMVELGCVAYLGYAATSNTRQPGLWSKLADMISETPGYLLYQVVDLFQDITEDWDKSPKKFLQTLLCFFLISLICLTVIIPVILIAVGVVLSLTDLVFQSLLFLIGTLVVSLGAILLISLQ